MGKGIYASGKERGHSLRIWLLPEKTCRSFHLGTQEQGPQDRQMEGRMERGRGDEGKRRKRRMGPGAGARKEGREGRRG